MKNLHLYISLLFFLTCAKEDSQAPNTPPTQIVKQYALTVSAGDGGSVTVGNPFISIIQPNYLNPSHLTRIPYLHRNYIEMYKCRFFIFKISIFNRCIK